MGPGGPTDTILDRHQFGVFVDAARCVKLTVALHYSAIVGNGIIWQSRLRDAITPRSNESEVAA